MQSAHGNRAGYGMHSITAKGHDEDGEQAADRKKQLPTGKIEAETDHHEIERPVRRRQSLARGGRLGHRAVYGLGASELAVYVLQDHR